MKNMFWKAVEDYKRGRITTIEFNNIRKQYRDYILEQARYEGNGEIPF
ncbi:hypothetical protein G8T75_12800 [Clostridium botulinum D/C]|nr:hypothetical protein [Clostridium botulinum]MCD3240836.1 hypothetical protein [Clostridium botulinum D/C]